MILKYNFEESNNIKRLKKDFTLEIEELTFEKHNINIPEKFHIGVIFGNSGSGKSLLGMDLINQGYNFIENIDIKNKNEPVINLGEYNEVVNRFQAVGFNTIPQWILPFNKLSNGQKYRVAVAFNLNDFTIFDEFTSFIDRNTAISLSVSLSKYIRKNNLKNIILITPHHDIIDYLEPDWVYDTNEREFYKNELFFNEVKNPKEGFLEVEDK